MFQLPRTKIHINYIENLDLLDGKMLKKELRRRIKKSDRLIFNSSFIDKPINNIFPIGLFANQQFFVETKSSLIRISTRNNRLFLLREQFLSLFLKKPSVNCYFISILASNIIFSSINIKISLQNGEVYS